MCADKSFHCHLNLLLPSMWNRTAKSTTTEEDEDFFSSCLACWFYKFDKLLSFNRRGGLAQWLKLQPCDNVTGLSHVINLLQMQSGCLLYSHIVGPTLHPAYSTSFITPQVYNTRLPVIIFNSMGCSHILMGLSAKDYECLWPFESCIVVGFYQLQGKMSAMFRLSV